MSTETYDFSKICRTCLSPKDDNKNIFEISLTAEADIVTVLKECASIQVSINI